MGSVNAYVQIQKILIK